MPPLFGGRRVFCRKDHRRLGDYSSSPWNVGQNVGQEAGINLNSLLNFLQQHRHTLDSIVVAAGGVTLLVYLCGCKYTKQY